MVAAPVAARRQRTSDIAVGLGFGRAFGKRGRNDQWNARTSPMPIDGT